MKPVNCCMTPKNNNSNRYIVQKQSPPLHGRRKRRRRGGGWRNEEWQKDCICKIVDVVKRAFFQITHIVRRKRMSKNIKSLFAILLMLDSFSQSAESRKKIVQPKEEKEATTEKTLCKMTFNL